MSSLNAPPAFLSNPPSNVSPQLPSRVKVSNASIVSPSNDIPWSVNVTSAMPREVMEKLNKKKYVAGCNVGRWFCAIVEVDDGEDVRESNFTNFEVYIWYANPTQTLNQQKFKSAYHKLDHGSFLKISKADFPHVCSPLVAMVYAENPYSYNGSVPSSTIDSVVYVYAANPCSGSLILWKISRLDLQEAYDKRGACYSELHPFGYKCTLFYNANHLDHKSKVHLTSMHVAWGQLAPGSANSALVSRAKGSPCVVLGSSDGRIFWLTQTHVPVSILVETISILDASDGSSHMGILSRLFTTPSKTKKMLVEGSKLENHCITKVLIMEESLSTSPNGNAVENGFYFLSACTAGKIVLWKAESQEASHRSVINAIITAEITCRTITDFYEQPFNDSIAAPHPSSVIKIMDVAMRGKTNSKANNLFISMLVATEWNRGDSRMYWIQSLVNIGDGNHSFEVVHIKWLDRFIDPLISTKIIGLAISENNDAYAAFAVDSNSEKHVVIALPFESCRKDAPSSVVGQLVLPSHLILLPNFWTIDTVTYGVSALDQSGIGLRIRYLLDHSRQAKSIRTMEVVNEADPSRLNSLVHHIYASHQESYIRPNDMIRLPPAIVAAIGSIDLEKALVQYCQKFNEDKSNGSVCFKKENYGNNQFNSIEFDQHIFSLVEWHNTYIFMLQQTGVYRTLSNIARWRLLEVGQELNVYQTLCTFVLDENSTMWSKKALDELGFCGMTGWLNKLQRTIVLQEGGGDDRISKFVTWLCAALDCAMTFREEKAMQVYYVHANQPPVVDVSDLVPIWTSNPLLQETLSQQLRFWSVSAFNRASATTEQIEVVVQCALLSYCDSFHACPLSIDTRQNYATCQAIAIDLIRKVKGLKDDHFAFELCQTHCYFNGLCQIAFDHESRSDHGSFSLVPLFSQLNNMKDIKSDFAFGHYVLEWHCRKTLFGHVLKYGDECPEILKDMIESQEILKPFKWICAARIGNFKESADLAFSRSHLPDLTLSNAKKVVDIASLCTSILEKEMPGNNSDVKRRRFIEKIRERNNAQYELYGVKNNSFCKVKDQHELLEYAIERLRSSQSVEKKIQFAVIAFAICTSFVEDDKVIDGSVYVWFEAILADSDKYYKWLKSVSDVDTELRFTEFVMKETVFGGLVNQCRISDGWDLVLYSTQVERAIFEKIANTDKSLFTPKLRRLLQMVYSKEASDDNLMII